MKGKTRKVLFYRFEVWIRTSNAFLKKGGETEWNLVEYFMDIYLPWNQNASLKKPSIKCRSYKTYHSTGGWRTWTLWKHEMYDLNYLKSISGIPKKCLLRSLITLPPIKTWIFVFDRSFNSLKYIIYSNFSKCFYIF